MCLIAYRNIPGSHISNDIIEYNLRSNPDGFGLAWRSPEGLKFEKFAPSESREFVQLLKAIDKTDMVYAAHWRTGTHGPKNKELAHPFPYKDKDGNEVLAFHNGIISIDTDKEESDTSMFVKYVLSGLKYKWWEDSAISFLVESSIGWSRILLMTENEDVFINQGEWKKENGIMYSTTPIWKSVAKPTATGIPLLTATAATSTPIAGGKTYRSDNYANRYGGWRGARNIDLEYDDDDDDYRAVFAKRTTNGRSVPKFYHKGHSCTPATTIDSGGDDGDRYGVVTCDECCTDGEYFVIDGILQIDLQHMSDLLQGELTGKVN